MTNSAKPNKKRIVVLISGSGTNLQAIIDACKSNYINGDIVGVVSNKADVYGLTRAEHADIENCVLSHKDYDSREAYDQALIEQINTFKPDLVILAGFMRILTANFVQQYNGKLLNIHPSLLPKYPGLHTHRKAIENNETFHGTTVHFVTEELDGGPLIGQSKTRLLSNDTEGSLNKRIQSLEHKLYPYIAKLLLNDKIKLIEDDVYFENRKLEKPIVV